MKHTLKWTGFILLAAAVGLALAVLATAGVRAQSPVSQAQLQATPGWMPPYPFSGPGMMGGWRSGGSGYGPTGVYTSTQALPYSAFGPGMMGNWQSGRQSGYGPGGMGGMMGGWGGQGAGSVSVTPEQASDFAQKWLDQYLPGTSAAEQAHAFYGYYTIHVLQDGQVFGMLSVNGDTGEVWYHTWHGDFIGMKELEE